MISGSGPQDRPTRQSQFYDLIPIQMITRPCLAGTVRLMATSTDIHFHTGPLSVMVID